MLAAALKAPVDYRFYRSRREETRQATTTILDRVGLDVDGARVLEIGPAVGAALNVFRARGAATCFVERNPLFAAECWRQRHRGRILDAVRDRGRIPACEVVYARGSFTPANFADAEDFSDWLDRLDSPAAILSPWMTPETPGWFAKTLEGHGYAGTGWVDGYSVPDIYPQAWVRAHRFS